MTFDGLPKLILVDPSAPLCSAWREILGDVPEVEIVRGRFENLPEYDCVVAAANSYGIMDGGIDAAIRDRFPAVEDRVRQRIAEEFHGYQPVGTSLIVATDDPAHPWVAHTPTVRIPSPLVGEMALNVHSAMWAMLCAVRQHNRVSQQPITTIACSGLGTAHGRVPHTMAARLMALAYDYHRREPSPPSWPTVRVREGELRSAGAYPRPG